MDYKALTEDFITNAIDPRVESFWRAIAYLGHGVAPMLLFLYRQDGYTAYAGEISRALHVSTARVASMLNNLEERGMVCRFRDQEDHRRILVELTPRGRAFYEEKKEEARQNLEQFLRGMGEADAVELTHLLARIAEINEKRAERPLAKEE